MFLQNIILKSFRNYEDSRFVPGRTFNYLHGSNGAGKTNVLESIYFLINLQSFRRMPRARMIKDGSKNMYLAGEFSGSGGRAPVRLEAAIGEGARKYKVNGKEEMDLFSYLGRVHAIVFFPESLKFVKEGPFLRRVVFDQAVASVDRLHLSDSREYQRLVLERNRLLKQKGDSDTISVWSNRLVKVAARIVVRRFLYLKSLRRLLSEIRQRMGVGSPLELVYRPAGCLNVVEGCDKQSGELKEKIDPGAMEIEVVEALQDKAVVLADRELELGRTLWGPHLDDFDIYWGGSRARDSASQGEQRLLMIVLALGMAKEYKRVHGDDPIILLDDLSSELDKEKRTAVMEYLGTMGAQVFITSTENPAEIKKSEEARVFFIENGKINAE